MTAQHTSPPTLHDVAREAEVSLATASRVLNGSARKVNEAYRDRVMAAADALGYVANLSAQAVARGTSMTVALVVADPADPYFSSIAAGVLRRADEFGLIVTMSSTDRDPRREIAIIRALRGQRPRGIIISGSRLHDDPLHDDLAAELTAYRAAGGTVAFVSPNDFPYGTVDVANERGGFELTTALLERGYRRFAVVTDRTNLRTSHDRFAGIRRALHTHAIDLEERHVGRGEFTRDGGFDSTLALHAAGGLEGREILLAVNDVMAVGAMSALRSLGIEPGRDIAVAGYDDIPTVRDVTPPLTTVHLPLESVGERVLELIMDPEAPSTAVEPSVVVRASTPDPAALRSFS